MESGFLANLDEWIKMQKNLLNTLRELEKKYANETEDRLDLILAARTAFQHIIRTIRAFDQWLQDPMVIKHMPKEMLEDVRKTSWSLLQQLLELDIRHTTQFKEIIMKLSKEGKLDPLIWTRPLISEEQGVQGRRGTMTTM
ncbi:MAG: DUF2153 domain-containing protein [Sulfolobaceae archaeon]